MEDWIWNKLETLPWPVQGIIVVMVGFALIICMANVGAWFASLLPWPEIRGR